MRDRMIQFIKKVVYGKISIQKEMFGIKMFYGKSPFRVKFLESMLILTKSDLILYSCFVITLRCFETVCLRSSHRMCSVRKGVLRNFAKFTENHLCQSLFFNKVAGLSKNSFFTEHLRTNASFIFLVFNLRDFFSQDSLH